MLIDTNTFTPINSDFEHLILDVAKDGLLSKKIRNLDSKFYDLLFKKERKLGKMKSVSSFFRHYPKLNAQNRSLWGGVIYTYMRVCMYHTLILHVPVYISFVVL